MVRPISVSENTPLLAPRSDAPRAAPAAPNKVSVAAAPATLDPDAANQSLRAAQRGRRRLMGMVAADQAGAAARPGVARPGLARPGMETGSTALAHALDIGAASLAYAAAVGNANQYGKALASGAAWTVSAALDLTNHTTFDGGRSLATVLADTANIGAGVASMVTTGLAHQAAPRQALVNYAASGSNGLWAVYGALTTLSAIQDGASVAGGQDSSTLAYAANGLRAIGGVASMAAAGAGMASTVFADGNHQTLNAVSAALWLAGGGFDGVSTMLSAAAQRRVERADTSPV